MCACWEGPWLPILRKASLSLPLLTLSGLWMDREEKGSCAGAMHSGNSHFLPFGSGSTWRKWCWEKPKPQREGLEDEWHVGSMAPGAWESIRGSAVLAVPAVTIYLREKTPLSPFLMPDFNIISKIKSTGARWFLVHRVIMGINHSLHPES